MSKKRKRTGNKIRNQEDALIALNNLIDHGIVSEDIVGEPVEGDLDFDEFIQNSIELAMGAASSDFAHNSSSKISAESDNCEEQNDLDSVCECKAKEKTVNLVGVTIDHISSGCFNILKMSDGIKDISFDLDLINQVDTSIEEDKVCGYAMAFLGFILPAFHPQRIGSKSYSGKYSEKAKSVIDFNTDKFKFYELSDLLLGYYVSDKSLEEFASLCVEMNSQGKLIDLFRKISDTLLSDGFNYMGLGGKIGVMGTLKPFVEMSERFMETFINDSETLTDSSKSADKMYEAISRVSVLPASYYEEIESFFSLFDYEESDDDEDEDDFDEDDEVSDYDVNTDDDNEPDEDKPEYENESAVRHMTEVMQYAISSSDADESDGLLDDVDGAEEVTVDINATEDNGIEANVSVAKSEPIVIDDEDNFVVRRR